MNISFGEPRTVGPRIRVTIPHLTPPEAARIALLVILDAVFAAVAQRDLEAVEKNLSAMMSAVAAKRRRA